MKPEPSDAGDGMSMSGMTSGMKSATPGEKP